MKRIVFFILIFNLFLYAQEQEKERKLTVSFEDLSVREVVHALNQKYGLNIVLERNVKGNVTLYLRDVTVDQLLKTIARTLGCSLNMEGNIYYFTKEKKEGLSISIEDGLMTLDCENIDITRVIREISKKSGLTIVTGEKVKGKVSGYIKSIPVKKGLKAFLSSKGYRMTEKEGIIEVVRMEAGRKGVKESFYISVNKDYLISMDVKDVELENFIDELSRKVGLNIIIYGKLTGKVKATVDNLPLDKTLDLILAGTEYGYRKIEDIYLIGSTEGKAPGASVIGTVTLLPLRYCKADDALKLMPPTISSSNLKVVDEHNALLFSGTEGEKRQIENFLDAIDIQPKRVRIRAIILSVSRKKLSELGMRVGYGSTDSVATLLPEFHRDYSKENIDNILEFISSSLKWGTTFEVPDNFHIILNALEQKGIGKVHAEPSIVTLSGQKASIDVGWVGYYRTRTGSPDNPIIQVHSVSAGVTLNITPWIGKENDVTVDVDIGVSSLKGIGPEGLPELSRRSVKTTLKLREGETAIIGGLIQKTENVRKDKIPILGDIPLIGDFLFSSKTVNLDESELIIYLTPEIIEWGE
ncbi:type II secretion system protein GspD [candidate division WOR-3 bacterium]|nr:type II secretion system protein GspD [candidate division WOR-3 bacterium]